MSLTHIETIELGSSQSSITFSSIPQDYDDLIIKVSARTDRPSAVIELIMLEFNGSSTGLSFVELNGNGSSANTSSGSEARVGYAASTTATANTFGNNSIYISNYTAATAKSFSADSVGETNATTTFMGIFANLWNNTSAVTSIELTGRDAGNFLTGSTFSLYGVTAGGDGTVTTS